MVLQQNQPGSNALFAMTAVAVFGGILPTYSEMFTNYWVVSDEAEFVFSKEFVTYVLENQPG